MDRNTEWPWSSEEEAEWKAELEERDYGFLEDLIDSAFEDATGSSYVLPLPQEEALAGDDSPEKYSVTA